MPNYAKPSQLAEAYLTLIAQGRSIDEMIARGIPENQLDFYIRASELSVEQLAELDRRCPRGIDLTEASFKDLDS